MHVWGRSSNVQHHPTTLPPGVTLHCTFGDSPQTCISGSFSGDRKRWQNVVQAACRSRRASPSAIMRQVLLDGVRIEGDMEFIIVCPLAFIAGFVDAIAGGGGLISLPAFIFAGLPVHNAIATNKLSSTMGTTIATVRYAINGYMVKAFVAIGVACGLTGSAIGSNLALATGDAAFKVIMLIILPFVAFFVLRTKNLDAFAKDELPLKRALAITAAIALCIGVYDGFYGPGTGTFLMLALTALAHQDVRTAAGTTKAINLSTNVAALVVFLVNGAVLLPLGIAAGVFNIAGNWFGSSSFTQHGSSIARPIMLVVIVLFAIRLVFDLIV